MMSFTLPIIIITVIVSIIGFNNATFMARYQFNAYMIHHRNQWYRFITHAFLHADWMHLIINMFVLFSFSRGVEYMYGAYLGELGQFYYLGLYFGAIIVASITTYRKHKEDHWYNAVGASGAVSAVLFASVIFSPFNPIYLYGIIKFPAIVWAALYVAYSIYSSKRANDNINHDAHLWGGAFGCLYTLVLNPDIARNFIDEISLRLG